VFSREVFANILLILFIGGVLLYNYIGLYVSRRHGSRIPWWPSIIKSKDYTFYLIYACYIALLLNGFISILEERYTLVPALSGFSLMFISMYINFAARRDLAEYWSPLASSGKNQKLIKSGIYTNVRHPIYLSGLILLLGVALIAGNIYGLLFFILSLIAIVTRIGKEEKELIAKFGREYEEYAKETPALIPRLRKS
jgi:protein-S-isoprenylcysteine O-methyltransferase Ste14